MRSGKAAAAITPVLCAGVGARDGNRYSIRLASFRLQTPDVGCGALGIVTLRPAAAAAITGLLSGRIMPEYGRLRVLGHDMTRYPERASARSAIGVATRSARAWPTISIRRLVERAARRSGQRRPDRGLLVAAVLDRLALTGWADVQLRAAPQLVARRARLAAACVHEPALVIMDGIFDDLTPADRAALARTVRELRRDTCVIAIGREADPLLACCDQVIAEADGIVTGQRQLPAAPVYEVAQVSPLDHAR